jgi:hypothetical protein
MSVLENRLPVLAEEWAYFTECGKTTLPQQMVRRELVYVAAELVSQFLQCLVSCAIRVNTVVANSIGCCVQSLMKLDVEEMTEQCSRKGFLGLVSTIPSALRQGNFQRLSQISNGGKDFGAETHELLRMEIALPFIWNCGLTMFHLERIV